MNYIHNEKQRKWRKAIRPLRSGWEEGQQCSCVASRTQAWPRSWFLMALPTPQLTLYTKLLLFIQSSAFRGKSLPQCLTQQTHPYRFPQIPIVYLIRLGCQLTPRPWSSTIWEPEDLCVGSVKLRMGGMSEPQYFLQRKSSGNNGLSLVPCFQPACISPLSNTRTLRDGQSTDHPVLVGELSRRKFRQLACSRLVVGMGRGVAHQ